MQRVATLLSATLFAIGLNAAQIGDLAGFFPATGVSPSSVQTQVDDLGNATSIQLSGDGSVAFTNTDFRTASINLPIDGAQVSRISVDMLVEQPVTGYTRSRAPGLKLQFGSRSLYLVFSQDGQRIQFGGTDGNNFGGYKFVPGQWYRFDLKLNYDNIEINVLDGNDKLLWGPQKITLAEATRGEWHGKGTLSLGMFNDRVGTGTSTTVHAANLALVSPSSEESKGNNGSVGSLNLEGVWKGRNSFFLDEGPQKLEFELRSLSSSSVNVALESFVKDHLVQSSAQESLSAHGSRTFSIDFDPALYGAGKTHLEVFADDAGGNVVQLTLPLNIYRARGSEQPYISWNSFDKEVQVEAREHGFTMMKAWSSEARVPTLPDLDQALSNGLLFAGHYGSTTFAFTDKVKSLPQNAFTRNADGSYSDKVNPFYSQYIDFSAKLAADTARPVVNHPAFSNFLINTEKKEGAIAYNAEALADARSRGYLKAGESFPQGFRSGDVPTLDTAHPSVERPSKGLISDDNIHYRVWTWWKAWGGYQPVHSAIYKALNALGVEMTVEFAQKDADYLEFWYRTVNDGENDPVFYNGHLTDMIYSARKYGHKLSALFQFVSSEKPMSADLFRQSAWIVFSHAPERMGHWGANRGFNKDNSKASQYAEQKAELKRLKEQVFDRLYPLTSTMDRPRYDVAFLKSEANWLYNDKNADKIMHDWRSAGILKYRERALSLAGVHWEPVHDEDVFGGALEDHRAVIVMGHKVLPRGVYSRLKDFASKGGKVFVDPLFTKTFDPLPGQIVIDANFGLIDSRSYWWPADGDATIMADYRKAAAIIQDAFSKAGIFAYGRTDSTSAVVNWLESDQGKVVFVINDLRTDTTQLARGIEQTVTLRLREKGEVVIYDLINGGKVDYQRVNGDEIRLEAKLGAADARVFAIYPREVRSADLKLPANATPGSRLEVEGTLNTDTGSSAANHLVHLHIEDADGPLPACGYYTARNGKILESIPVLPSAKGQLNVTITDVASGISKLATVRLPSRSGSIWETVAPDVEGWKHHGWFGWIYEVPDGWIYHATLGWMYYTADSLSSIWFFRPDHGWFWSSKAVYPIIWNDTDQDWHYYWTTTSEPAWFTKLSNNEAWYN